MTTSIDQAVQKIEAALKALETDFSDFVKGTVEPAVKAEFAALGPQVLGLGETVLSMVWQEAGVYLAALASGTPISAGAAIAAIVAQLPEELKALEHLVAAAFAGAVHSQSQPAAPAA